MATRKYIYWRPDLKAKGDGTMFANIHLLVGYNQGSISDFQKMADELRKTFPLATDDEIRAGKVFKSTSVHGFSIITWDTDIPRGDYPGWHQHENGVMEYLW